MDSSAENKRKIDHRPYPIHDPINYPSETAIKATLLMALAAGLPKGNVGHIEGEEIHEWKDELEAG